MMHWRLGGLASLHWQYFDGDWVIYDDGSGQTLVADPVMAAAMMALESGCSSSVDIEAQVRHDLPANLIDDLSSRLADGLTFLHQIGLVEMDDA